MKEITKIFDKDISLDVKDDLIRDLRSQKTIDEIINSMLQNYADTIDDIDEAPYFWSVFSYILWEYGVLPVNIRNQALKYFDGLYQTQSGVSMHERIKDEINIIADKIKIKNQTPRKIKKSRLYVNSWKIGDVYALPLKSEYALNKGVQNQYLIFINAGEMTFYPGHIIPVCRVKITKDDILPKTLDDINKLEYVLIGVDRFNEGEMRGGLKAFNGLGDLGEYPIYTVGLIITSFISIPKNLKYIGNFKSIELPKTEYILKNIEDSFSCFWKFTEKILIDRYFGLNKRQAPRYDVENYGGKSKNRFKRELP
ncbi:hypothetical protein RJI07_01680 [Mycoplasmatota bacterium WC30]